VCGGWSDAGPCNACTPQASNPQGTSRTPTPGQITGGRNGYGAKLANIFSRRFTVETCDGKRQRRFAQTFTNNMSHKTGAFSVCVSPWLQQAWALPRLLVHGLCLMVSSAACLQPPSPTHTPHIRAQDHGVQAQRQLDVHHL
jgi:hypothetical protein